MPVPGSQEIESLGVAYFLYAYRWFIRVFLVIIALSGITRAWKGSKVMTILMIAFYSLVSYVIHSQMAADTMFYQPKYLQMLPADLSKVDLQRIVLGIEFNGQAKAYPIQYLGYHHQVHDTIGGKPVIVTYCTVCRTGRVYEPLVNGKPEKFRLVGMDHYNAMFEDVTTRSWWRQVTGEAVAGPLKGQLLPEMPAIQSSLEAWLKLHPGSLVMQPDSNFTEAYAGLSDYESGLRKGKLTGHDTLSWKEKSWIAGIEIGTLSKAYDWNLLVSRGVINDIVDTHAVCIVVTPDHRSLFAFRRLSQDQQLTFRNDTLSDGSVDYYFSGQAMDTTAASLNLIPVFQEYWHSWRTFHPSTQKYEHP